MLTEYEQSAEQLAITLATEYLKRFYRQLTARFAFDGDKRFTKRNQRLFFQAAFKYQHIGVQIIPEIDGVNLPSGLQVLKLAPSEWNLDGSIQEATAIKAVQKALPEISPTFDEKTTVVFNYFMNPLFSSTISPESAFRRGPFKLIKSLFYELLMMIPNETKKIILKKASTTLKQHQKDTINPQKKTIEITQGDTDSGIGIVPDQAATAANTGVAVLDLKSDLKLYIESLDMLTAKVDEMLGQRTNTAYKNVQVSQVESIDAQSAVFVFEREMRTTFEIFVEEYNEKFDANLVLVDYLQEYMDEVQEKNNQPGEVANTGTDTYATPESEA